MADIEVKCDKCGDTLVISEFIDRARCFCRKCGSKISPRQTEEQAASRLHLKQFEATSVAPQAAGPQDDAHNRDWLPDGGNQHASTEFSHSMAVLHNVAGWTIFILLAGVMGILRYTQLVSHDMIPKVLSYGPYAVMAFHILITLKAFKDSIFHGVLCLLVPLYSFYYLFLLSDDFYLRAVVGGMLVGIGQDSAIYFNDIVQDVVTNVSAWIRSGG